MKQNKILFIVFLFLILFIAACKTKSMEMETKEYDSEFKKMCEDRTPDNWMNMKPMRDGEFTLDESCWGCMSDDGMNHYCTKEEYLEYLSSQNE